MKRRNGASEGRVAAVPSEPMVREIKFQNGKPHGLQYTQERSIIENGIAYN
jgi:hypothetical protein